MHDIEKIYVFGGTHGNEFTGAYIVNNWDTIFPENSLQSDIDIIPVLSNPKAFRNKVRYIDNDLNRMFSVKNLEGHHSSSYEIERAKSINHRAGPKIDNRNFIIDTHTTNASMGVTLITADRDPHTLNLIKYISDHIGSVNVIYTDIEDKESPYLASIAKHHLIIEIGSIANSIVDHNIFDKTKAVIRLTIDYLNRLKNSSIEIDKELSIPAFTVAKSVKFPRDENGDLAGMIHKEIQGKDFIKKIDKNTNIFMLFSGEAAKLNEEGEYYMSFINESAYYEEDTAFYLMNKIDLIKKMGA